MLRKIRELMAQFLRTGLVYLPESVTSNKSEGSNLLGKIAVLATI
ncbi:hypothetical protein AM1_0662 [Acaryochloris marina MBIC11017]|uniref:Uncharacterized protein n=1 Tax=Acaryochloris marina (strain MBIC 11017) TaxID=329726 RepID=B0CE77_ACAM1|nr:hypothetical protein AM1_0662 [Acaryochloris marina MBIC11017]